MKLENFCFVSMFHQNCYTYLPTYIHVLTQRFRTVYNKSKGLSSLKPRSKSYRNRSTIPFSYLARIHSRVNGIIFFYQSVLSQTLTIHGTRARQGTTFIHSVDSSLSLPLAHGHSEIHLQIYMWDDCNSMRFTVSENLLLTDYLSIDVEILQLRAKFQTVMKSCSRFI